MQSLVLFELIAPMVEGVRHIGLFDITDSIQVVSLQLESKLCDNFLSQTLFIITFYQVRFTGRHETVERISRLVLASVGLVLSQAG